MALQRFSPQEERLSAGSQAQFQEKARTFANLSDKLGQWEDIAYKKAAKARVNQAQEQAVKDQMQGKEFHKESVYTVYGEAYNTARKATYLAQTELDIQNKSNEYAKQYANDPMGYKASMEQFIKTTADETQIPDVEFAIGLTGEKLIASQFGKLNDEVIKKEKETQRVVFAQHAEQQQSALINAITSNDTKSATLIREGLDQYTTALMEDGVIDDTTFVEYYENFEFGVKRGVLETTMNQYVDAGDLKSAKKLYDQFTKEIPAGFTYDQHRALSSTMGTSLNSAIKARKAAAKEARAVANARMQDAIDILNSGKVPKFSISSSVMANASESRRAKYEFAKEAQAEYAKISSLTISEQEIEVNKYKANPTASKMDIKVLKQMDSNLKQRKKMWKTDPVTQGVVELGHEDFALDFDSPTILDDIKKRDNQRKQNVEEAGPIADKLLKETEVTQLSAMLQDIQTPLKQKQEILQIINSAGKDTADKIYNELGGKKAYTFSYAGKLTSLGNNNAAIKVLQGNGADIQLEEGTKQTIQSKLQGVFQFSPSDEFNTNLKGTIDYIKGKTISDPSYEVDVNEALEETIGKVEKYNGANVVLPYNTKTEVFESFLDNIDIDEAELPKEVQEDLKDMTDTLGSGDVQLHRVGDGKYRIFYPNGGNGYYQSTSDGKKPYILEYK